MSGELDWRLELADAIFAHEQQHGCAQCPVAVTTECRKKMLRSVGGDEDSPTGPEETVYGHPVVVDDSLPAEPGFAIRGEHW